MIQEGRLQDFPLADLLQILVLSRATGVLSLRSEGRLGCLGFAEGALTGVCLGARTGLDAGVDLFLWETGVFDFAPGSVCENAPAVTVEALTRAGLSALAEARELKSRLPETFAARAWLHPAQLYTEASPEGVRRLGAGARYAEWAAGHPEGEREALLELVSLVEADLIGVASAPEAQLRALAELAANSLYRSFAAISGAKMVAGLEEAVHRAAESVGAPLRFVQGAWVDGLPDALDKAALAGAYRPVLEALTAHLDKIYGPGLATDALELARTEAAPAQRALWGELFAARAAV